MMLAWVTYVAGDGLPALGGKADAYRIDGAVDAARVSALASALGMHGDARHEGPLWHLQDGDKVLEVYEESGGSWWYSPNQGMVWSGGGSSSGGCDPDATECAANGTGTVEPATTSPDATCANDGTVCATGPATSTTSCPANAKCIAPVPPVSEPCAAGADCPTQVCSPDGSCPPPPVPQPPADLPSKAEARTIALDLLGATGMDLSDAKVTVDGPYEAWYVTVEPKLDGVPVSGWQASVAVGSKGAIMSAGGTLATPERLGSYPLLDTRAAIERLNKLQNGGYGGGPMPLGAPGAARDSGVATAVAPMPTIPCQPNDPSCAALVDPAQQPTTTVIVQQGCKVQPDGTEICETTSGSVSPGAGTVECIQPPTEPGTDPAVTRQTTTDCVQPGVGICTDRLSLPPVPADGSKTTPVPSPECQAYPQPKPVEVVLTAAEPVLTMLPSSDGSTDVYLVPGYRFSNADGAQVDVAAVADDSLAPTTTMPDTTNSSAVTPTTSCEVAAEGDSSGTTHTIQTCPQPTEPRRLEPGQTPEIGVGYYVDVDVACQAFTLGDQIWRLEKGDLTGWSVPHEGGAFTLDAPDHGAFVGDGSGTKTATFVTGTDQQGCQPAPRG
ncbi:MAG: hypothetical protein ABIY48_05385, partial [Acidimicrobiales bacterium]